MLVLVEGNVQNKHGGKITAAYQRKRLIVYDLPNCSVSDSGTLNGFKGAVNNFGCFSELVFHFQWRNC